MQSLRSPSFLEGVPHFPCHIVDRDLEGSWCGIVGMWAHIVSVVTIPELSDCLRPFADGMLSKLTREHNADSALYLFSTKV